MKKYYCLYTLLAALTMFLGAAISSDVLAASESVKVEIKNYKFGPESVDVQPGQSVVWENLDGASHTILIDGKESPRLARGADYSQVFSAPGVHKYQCGLHPSMKGVITVAGSASSAAASAGIALHGPSVPTQQSAPVPVKRVESAGIKKVGAPIKVIGSAAASGKQAENTISIVDFMRFSPAVLKVKAGTTVTWTNYDGSNHIILMGDVRSQRLKHDSTFTHTFSTPGEYSYICAIHGEKMSGKVIVM